MNYEQIEQDVDALFDKYDDIYRRTMNQVGAFSPSEYAQILLDAGIELTTQDMFDWVNNGIFSGEQAGSVAAEYIKLLRDN